MKKVKFMKIIPAIMLFSLITGCIYAANDDYAIKLDNVKISIAEYKAYLYEQKKLFEEKGGKDIWATDFDGTPAEEIAKQNAVNSIIVVKTANEQAQLLDISLSEDEKQTAIKEGEKFYDMLNIEYPDIEISLKLAQKIIMEGAIQQKVYDYVTAGFEISQPDFDVYFEEYYEENKKELNTVKIRYIFKASPDENGKDTIDEAENIYEKILLNEDFARLEQLYSDSSEKGVIQLQPSMLDSYVEDAAYSLAQGEISDIVRTDNGYYIIKAEEVITPDMEHLKQQQEEAYVSQKKQEIYNAQSQKWSEDVVVEKNEKVWNSITF